MFERVHTKFYDYNVVPIYLNLFVFRCMDYLQIQNAANTVLIEKCGNDIGKLKNYTVSESKLITQETLTTLTCQAASQF